MSSYGEERPRRPTSCRSDLRRAGSQIRFSYRIFKSVDLHDACLSRGSQTDLSIPVDVYADVQGLNERFKVLEEERSAEESNSEPPDPRTSRVVSSAEEVDDGADASRSKISENRSEEESDGGKNMKNEEETVVVELIPAKNIHKQSDEGRLNPIASDRENETEASEQEVRPRAGTSNGNLANRKKKVPISDWVNPRSLRRTDDPELRSLGTPSTGDIGGIVQQLLDNGMTVTCIDMPSVETRVSLSGPSHESTEIRSVRNNHRNLVPANPTSTKEVEQRPRKKEKNGPKKTKKSRVLSESEVEDDPESREEPPQESSPGDAMAQQLSSVRLVKHGPKLKVEIVKMETDLSSGYVSHLPIVPKSPEKEPRIRAAGKKRKGSKAEHHREREENVPKKKAALKLEPAGGKAVGVVDDEEWLVREFGPKPAAEVYPRRRRSLRLWRIEEAP